MSTVDVFARYLRACYLPAPVRVVRVESSATSVADPLEQAVLTVFTGPDDLDTLLARQGLRTSFRGWSPEGERVALLERRHRKAPCPAPALFRVAAIVPTFNEADVIAHTLQYLIDDGIDVYVVDNRSTDATVEIVRQFEGKGLLGVERFPAEPAPKTYDLRAILGRIEELVVPLEHDWVMLHDADERRRGPWPGVGLRDALYHVDRAGYTCVDHVTLNFWPTDNGYLPTHDVEEYFAYFEFSDHTGHFHQRRAWKNLGEGVSLAPSAGHDVGFYGRRVYPFKFLLKHYPFRSRSHGEYKVLHERKSRWNAAERALGWHAQYDQIDTFVRRAADLEHFDAQTFYERRLIERLSGVGVFDGAPEWATPPTWNDAGRGSAPAMCDQGAIRR
ncbi:MAG: glycosyltransferase [Chloroflexi bacterium]|nr:glycosyltransferase [Chloroflexota bacterium]